MRVAAKPTRREGARMFISLGEGVEAGLAGVVELRGECSWGGILGGVNNISRPVKNEDAFEVDFGAEGRGGRGGGARMVVRGRGVRIGIRGG